MTNNNPSSVVIKRIILVDDEKAVRDATAQSLMLAGFDVETFEHASAALNHLTHLPPDFDGVVVSDIRMPGMDGLEFLQRDKREGNSGSSPLSLRLRPPEAGGWVLQMRRGGNSRQHGREGLRRVCRPPSQGQEGAAALARVRSEKGEPLAVLDSRQGP